MSILSDLPERYRLILCDLWGCVHNGYELLPGALDRLQEWKAQGGTGASRGKKTVARKKVVTRSSKRKQHK